MFFDQNGRLDVEFERVIYPVLAYLDVYLPQYDWISAKPKQSICSAPMEEVAAQKMYDVLIAVVDEVNKPAINKQESTTTPGKFRVWLNYATFNLNPGRMSTIDKFEIVANFLNEVHCPKLSPPFKTVEELEGAQVWLVAFCSEAEGKKPYLFYVGPNRDISHVRESEFKAWNQYCLDVKNTVFYNFGIPEENAGFTNKLIEKFQFTIKSNEDKKIASLGKGYFYFSESVFTDQLYYLAEKYYRKQYKSIPLPTPKEKKQASTSAPQISIPAGTAQKMQNLGICSKPQFKSTSAIPPYPIYRKR